MQLEQSNDSFNYWRAIAREVTPNVDESAASSRKPLETETSPKANTSIGEQESVLVPRNSSERATDSKVSSNDLVVPPSGVETVSDNSGRLSTCWDPDNSWRQYPDLVESALLGKKAQELSKCEEDDVFKYYLDSENNLRPLKELSSPNNISIHDSEVDTVSEHLAWESWRRVSQNVENDSSAGDELLEDDWNEIDRWRPVVDDLNVYRSDGEENHPKDKNDKLSQKRERMAWQKWFSMQQYNLSPAVWERHMNVTDRKKEDTQIYKQWLSDIEQDS